MKNQRIRKLAITGGPCGGKDTAIVRLVQALENMGYEVYVQPESATELFSTGVRWDRVPSLQLQQMIFYDTLHKENQRFEAAHASRSPKEKIILCNRGLLDTRAYMTRLGFAKLARQYGFTFPDLWARYDGAFHLVTAADGAEGYYTLTNNSARKETPDKARKLDELTRNAWNGHPHFRLIGNHEPGGFEGKYQKLLREVCHLLGKPVPLEIERWFLVKPISLHSVPVDHVIVNIEQTYLLTSRNEEMRVRRRGLDGSYAHYLTYKRHAGGVRFERESVISEVEYRTHLLHRLPRTRIIRKDRCCFLWKELYFELDRFYSPRLRNLKLEVELTKENAEIEVPPFLEVIKEVTGDPQYSNFSLAQLK